MKFLLLFMFIAAALASQDSMSGQDRLAHNLSTLFNIGRIDAVECINKSEVTMEDMRYMSDAMDVSDTEATDMKSLRRASCTVVCCAQKLGLMVKGDILIEELLKFYEYSSLPEEMQMSLSNTVRICKEEVTDTSDECMVGFEFSKCVYERTQSMVQHK